MRRSPRPEKEDFKDQLELVRDYADLRADRLPEIMTQAGYPVPYLTGIAGLQPGRKQYSHELLGITQVFATQIVLAVKHALACHRPDAFSSQVQPVIPTPGHGTLPSGHATEAFAMAVVLAKLLEFERGTSSDLHVNQLMRQAARIAANRTVAGVHFPADSIAGAMLGLLIGHYVVLRGTGCGCVEPAIFNGRKVVDRNGSNPVNRDFDPSLYEVGNNDPRKRVPVDGHGIVTRYGKPLTPTTSGIVSEPLQFLWQQAEAEWKKR